MVTQMLAKIAIGMAMRLVTEKFASNLLIEGLRAWSRSTENKYDDRVVAEMAKALGVDPEVVKKEK